MKDRYCGHNQHFARTLIILAKKQEMEMTGIYPRTAWVNNTNIYEVNVRQYTEEGTFAAFEKELPRLREMGIETLWFMPVTPIAQLHKKGSLGSPYACSDYTAVNREFGTEDDFRSLISLAHLLGFKVIIDWVANHTGWDHVWTITNPGFYKTDDATHTFSVASGMDDIIELDYANTQMRTAMIEAMRFWITTFDIDGFRCDLASWVDVGFWHEARTALEQTKNLLWLAEADPVENPQYMEVFDAAYTWKWMHTTEDFYKKNLALDVLTNLLPLYDTIPGHHALKLWFTSNHDENSWNGTEYEKYGEMALSLAVHSFTWNGIPLIYSGQELPNHKRLAFFEKDCIEWNGLYAMSAFYKTLLSLRKNNPALNAADPQAETHILHPHGHVDNLICYLRRNGVHEVLVLLNLGKENLRFKFADQRLHGNFKDVFDREKLLGFSTDKTVEMLPWQFFVLEKMS